MYQSSVWCREWLIPVLACLAFSSSWASEAVVYKCPGTPVTYTDSITPKEAKDKGCSTLEGAPVTIISGPTKSGGSTAPASNASSKVDPGDQKARDADRKQILATELKKEEAALAALKAEYNEGEAERRGDEKNYQRYQDRVTELKAAIARKESDISALKREMAK